MRSQGCLPALVFLSLWLGSFSAWGATPATNDSFAGRVSLNGAALAVTLADSTTRETNEPAHAGNSSGGSLWWMWQAPATGTLSLWAPGDSGQDLAVYTGPSLGSLVEIGSTNQTTTIPLYLAPPVYGMGVSLNVPVTAGQVYQIAYAGVLGQTGQVALHLNQPPTIISSATSSGTAGASYAYQIYATDGPTGYTATGLPDGLSVNPYSGLISGTLQSAGQFAISLGASNAAGSGSAVLALTVNSSAPAASAPSAPVFTGAAGGSGVVGQSFSYYPSASGSSLTYSSDALPAGLSLDPSYGEISGTPQVAGEFQVHLTASNSVGTATAIATLFIAPAPAVPVIDSSATASATVGTVFTYSIQAANTPATYGASNLPPGLTLNAASGQIAGVPTTAGTYVIPISASNGGGTGTAALTLTVSTVAPVTPSLLITSNNTASGLVGSSFVYAINGGSSATSFAATGLPPGLSLNQQNGYITGVPLAAGVYTPILTASDGMNTVTATIQITVAGTAGSAASGSTLAVTSPAAAVGHVGSAFSYSAAAGSLQSASWTATGLPSGLSISNGGTISGTPSSTGTYPVTLNVSGTLFGNVTASTGTAIVTIQILSALPPPSVVPLITSAASASATMGSSFSYRIAADNSPTTYDASGLPGGLTINASTGAITGTPSVVGSFPVALSAMNAVGTGTATLTIVVANVSAPILTSDSFLYGTVGVVLDSFYFFSSGGVDSISVGNLPPGLSFDPSSKQITGTPTVAGVFQIPVTATKGSATSMSTLTAVISATQPPPLIYSAATASGTLGTAFSYTIYSAGTSTTYSVGSLPPGLSFSGQTISGTPTQTGTWAIPISATGPGGTSNATLTLTISLPAPPVLSVGATALGTVGEPFSLDISATGSPQYTLANLPPGLSLQGSNIVGTPTTAGVYPVTDTATNAGGSTSVVITITIQATAPPSLPVFTNAAEVSTSVGTTVSFLLKASNSPTSFAATGLPAGLSFDSGTGLIAGVPSAAGTSSVAVSATNDAGTTTAVLTIVVAAAPFSAPSFSSALNALGQTGEPFFYRLAASPAAASFTVSALPSGLIFNSATGVISGTPASAGSTTVTLTGTNSAGTGTASLRIVVSSAAATSRLTSAAAAAGQVGVPFTYTLTTNQSSPSYTVSSLPDGLSASGGVISGTPTVAGTFTIPVSSGSASGTLTLIIGQSAPAVPIISNPLGQNAIYSQSSGLVLTATNAPTGFAASGLPAGLSLDPATGVISGLPQALGTFPVTITAANAAGQGSAVVTIHVLSNSFPVACVLTSPAETSVVAGSSLSYQLKANTSVTSYSISGLPSGLVANSYTGTITGIVKTAGTYTVTIGASSYTGSAGGTLILQVLPAPPGPPAITSTMGATAYLGTSFTYQITATLAGADYTASGLPAGLTLDGASGLISGQPLAAGTFTIPLTVSNSQGSGAATLTLAVSDAPLLPQIINQASLALTTGTSGVVATISAVNGPQMFSASGLPPGLSLDPISGRITGTLSTVGVYPVSVAATNAAGTAAATIMFNVAGVPAPVFTSSTEAEYDGFSGSLFQTYLYAIGSPIYSATGLPTGLSLNPTTGLITGTPTVPGVYTVPVTITNAAGSATAVLTMSFPAATEPPQFAEAPLFASGTVGTSLYTYIETEAQLSSEGEDGTVAASGLPPGLSQNSYGNITGTPTVAGLFPVTLTITGSGGSSSTIVNFVIAPAPAPLVSAPLGATAYLGGSFSYSATVTNTVASYSATGLPPGLAIDSTTGKVTGTPSVVGEYLATLSAVGSGGSGSAQVRFRILAAPGDAPVISSPAALSISSNRIYSTGAASGTMAVSFPIQASGAPTSFAASNLPPGLSLNPFTGQISGTPLTAGVYQVPISATGPGGTGTATLTIIAADSVTATSRAASVRGNLGVPISVSLGVTSGVGSSGGTPLTFPTSYSVSGLPPGLTVNTSTGQVSGTPTVAGTFVVWYQASDAAGVTTAPFTFLIDTTSPAPSAPQFTTEDAGQRLLVGENVNLLVAAFGQPTSFTAVGLPPGVSLAAVDGTLNGVPTKLGEFTGHPTSAGLFQATIQAQNSVGTASAILTFAVDGVAARPTINGALGGSAHVGTQYTYFMSASVESPAFAFAKTYTASNLPAGLALDSVHGEITGTPQATGTYTIPYTVTVDGATADAVVTLVVSPAIPPAASGPPGLSAPAGAIGYVGVPFSFSIQASSADQLNLPTLPAGLAANIATTSGGKVATVTGIPTTPGLYTLPITATSSLGTAGATLTWAIVAPQAAIPFITADPQGQSVNEGASATFTGSAVGVPLPGYQWYRDGVAVPGANSSTLTVQLADSSNAGAYTLVATNSTGSATSAPAQLTVMATYASWQSVHFSSAEISAGLADASADPSGQGISNLLAYALGLDPHTGTGGTLPAAASSGDGEHLEMVFTRDSTRPDLTFTVEGSSDLFTWTPLAGSTSGTAVTSVGNSSTVTETGGAVKSVTVQDAASAQTSPRRFMRLRVTQP